MGSRRPPPWLCCRSLVSSPPLSTGFAQGSLTPPGPPGPTLKTLTQVEPRTPISALPYIITNSGSYYLTGTLTGIAGTNGIMINAIEVTLDLNGFGLVGVPGSLDGIGTPGVFVFQTNVTIMNGALRNWGGNGINVPFFYNTVFRDLLLETNGGAGLNAGTFATIRNCIANRNGGAGFNAGRNHWPGFGTSRKALTGSGARNGCRRLAGPVHSGRLTLAAAAARRRC